MNEFLGKFLFLVNFIREKREGKKEKSDVIVSE